MHDQLLVEICSYHFPFSPSKLIPFYGGAEYHDYHHYAGGRSQSNFAPLFTYCDYIYRTDKVSWWFLIYTMLIYNNKMRIYIYIYIYIK